MAGHVTLVAISGGVSDIQVPPHLTVPPSVLPRNHSSSPSLAIAASAVPRNWVSADHQAVVWWEIPLLALHHHYITLFCRCRRLQLAVTRALFLLQDPSTNQLTSDLHQQWMTFHHLLFTGWKVPISPVHTTSERSS